MKNIFFENKGITMIAIIITIIVTLILATVSISYIVGEEGSIKRSNEAIDKKEMAEIADRATLIGQALVIKKISNSDPSLASVTKFIDVLLSEYEVEDVDTNGDTIIELNDKYAILIKNTKLELEVVEQKSPYFLTIDEAKDIWETDGKGRIIKYSGTDSNVIVPIKIGEEYIVGLGEKVFKDNLTLTDIKICGNIKNLGSTGDSTAVANGEGAFRNCTNLKTVTIYDGVGYIGGSAFRNCTGLVTITIPNSVKHVASFSDSKPGSVSWGSNMLTGCTNLKTIYLEADEYSSEKNYAFDDAPFGAPNAQVIDLRKK